MKFLKGVLLNLLIFIQIALLLVIVLSFVAVVFMKCEIRSSSGNSMLPVIDHNYIISVPVTSKTDLAVGDIVVYGAHVEGQPINISHRIIAINDSGQSFVLKGDNNDLVDTPFFEDTGGYSDQIPRRIITHKITMVIPHVFDPIMGGSNNLMVVNFRLLIMLWSSIGASFLIYFVPAQSKKVEKHI